MDIDPKNPNLLGVNPPVSPPTNAYGPTYMGGRKRYSRPQAVLFSDNAGVVQDGLRYPSGYEKEDFIILSDHNRKEINIGTQRLETRKRMVNGTMRSYHIGDKITLSLSWNRLPSRSYSRNVNFNESGSPVMSTGDTEYTVDGGAGGVEILDWYENHPGPFYVYLAYDKYNSDSFKQSGNVTDESFTHLGIYNDVRHMYFSGFDYSIEKRGANNFDFWNISVSLEEV
jgi:hypothetical protein